MYRLFILLSILFGSISCSNAKKESVTVVERPNITAKNSNYISNRAPLKPSAFIKLPVGAVKPEGWLKVYLEKQRDGLTGHLGEISAWLQKEDNAWLSPKGEGKWGWEELPYWLKGFAHLGYILQDKRILDEAKMWLDGTIQSQRADGNFGPKIFHGKNQDFWGNMIMLYCLQSYYEYTNDKKVLEMMTRYFKFQMTVPDKHFLKGYWQKVRGGDNLHSVMWLYNRTGDKFLLELAEKIHRNTSDWTSRNHELSQIHSRKHKRENVKEWPEWYKKQIDWHNVNHAQCFREPAQYALLSGKEKDIKASYENFDIIRTYFGQVPGGMFGADENARPGYDDPRQGIETCGIVEQMNSNEHMLRITGDPFWADHTEEVAFNTYPSAVTEDFKALHYITSPNMVLCDAENHYPGIDNKGPFLMMNPFSSRCCQHNHSQGWPYFVENLWMATPDNGVLAAMYSSSVVNVKVANGKNIRIKETTNYPFDENISFELSTETSVNFPLYLRIPKWCEGATVAVNGKKLAVNAEASKYVRVQRNWKNGDKVTLNFPMKLAMKKWEKNHNSVSLSYGPLTYSLKIDEKYIKRESDKTAIFDSQWQKGADIKKWPSFEIHPTTAWNYGLVLSEKSLEEQFEVVKKAWPKNNFPFTVNSVPIMIKAKAKKIDGWKIDEHGLCGELPESPVVSKNKVEEVELIPMGAAKLRISAFPVVK